MKIDWKILGKSIIISAVVWGVLLLFVIPFFGASLLHYNPFVEVLWQYGFVWFLISVVILYILMNKRKRKQLD